MKKSLVLLIAIVFVTTPLFAAAVTDATKPLGHLKWSVAAEDNYTFKKDMHRESDATLEIKKMNQVYGKVSVGVTPYFNLYGKLGASDGGDVTTVDAGTGYPLKVTTDYGFLWGAGLSGAKEVVEGWKIGLDAQFNFWEADADKVTFNNIVATNVSGSVKNYDMQITPFVTRKFEWKEMNWAFNPYVGGVVSYLWSTTARDLKFSSLPGYPAGSNWAGVSDKKVGIVVGSDIEFEKNWSLAVEGRFIDETAITAGGSYRF